MGFAFCLAYLYQLSGSAYMGFQEGSVQKKRKDLGLNIHVPTYLHEDLDTHLDDSKYVEVVAAQREVLEAAARTKLTSVK